MALPTLVAMAARDAPAVTVKPVTVDVHVPTITPFTFTPVHRTDCVTMTPDPSGFVPPQACNALWEYFPNMAAAVIFSIIFGALLIIHTTQAVVYRKKFCWVLLVATSWLCGAFILRSIAVHNQQSSPLATVSQLLVLLAPLWLNAFVYMVFARLIYFLIPSHRLHGILASKVAFVFVWLDFLSFVIQLIGSFAASPGAPPDQIQSGLHIYMGGIGIQEFWILIVLALAVSLWVEIRKIEQSGGLRFEEQRAWRKTLIVVYVVLGLITVRVIFRLAEFSGGVGTSNPLPFHEVYFYVFDAVPMSLAIALLAIIHPGTLFQGPYSEFPSLSRRQKKEIKRIRKEAQQVAKGRGESKFRRWRLGREIKRQETERIASEKWGVKDIVDKPETWVDTGY